MSKRKKILLGFLLLLVAIQFIQPGHNTSKQAQPADISRIFSAPENVQAVLHKACYDCHSNNTHYPWYSSIQPGGWIMAWHIRQGKQQLNFSEFGTMSSRKEDRKLGEAVNQIKHGDMPLASYRMLHREAALSDTEKLLIIDWMYQMKYNLSINRN